MRYLLIIAFAALGTYVQGQGIPVITGQVPLSITENQSLTIALDNLSVVDSVGNPYPDYPAGFTLELFEGENYSFTGTTITPAQDFTGMLTVPLRVNDGLSNSELFDLVITVVEGDDGGDNGDDDDDGDDNGGDDDGEIPNTPPVIIGQAVLSVNAGASLTLQLSDLFVSDPDDTYPEGFTLSISSGVNYTVDGNSITPAAGFSGTIAVPVTVSDGEASSAPFNVSITVIPPPVNVPPVITGQRTLSTLRDQPVAITFAHLFVTDPDNSYPSAFTLALQDGLNYTVNGNQVIPATGFTGTLSVGVVVNDGTSSSNVFPFQIAVIEPAVLQITSQKTLETPEDTPIAIALTDLVVNDPENRYPEGFQLLIAEGENYVTEGLTVTPAPDYSGILEVTVRVSDATRQSEPFVMTITVAPVNDRPVIEGIPQTSIVVDTARAVPIFPQISITDVDNENLSFAEVYFRTGSYQMNADELFPSSTGDNIRAVFDPASGSLFLVGEAPVSEYVRVLRSVNYQFNVSDSLSPAGPKYIEVVASDGRLRSEVKQIQIGFSETGELDIPMIFTPNGDNLNDTWNISGFQANLEGQIAVRVFDTRGLLVFESTSLAVPWDGTMNGSQVPSATYLYTIEVNMPFDSRTYKGVVTIIR